MLEDSLVVNVRDAGTREQIRAMFDKISCWLLPHPGTDMTKVSSHNAPLQSQSKDATLPALHGRG